jgi:hypothetical protein
MTRLHIGSGTPIRLVVTENLAAQTGGEPCGRAIPVLGVGVNMVECAAQEDVKKGQPGASIALAQIYNCIHNSFLSRTGNLFLAGPVAWNARFE